MRWLGLGVAALVAVFVAALALVDTGIGELKIPLPPQQRRPAVTQIRQNYYGP